MARRVVRVVLVLLCALAGIGRPGAAAAQAVRVRMGSPLSPPALDGIAPYVALERGLFRKYGVDAQIVEFRGGPINVKALLAGEMDVSIILGATDAIAAYAKGARVRAFLVPVPVSPAHIVARRDAATTVQGLAGKTLAVSGIGTLSHHIPRIILERNGMDPDRARYVTVGSPADRFKALLAGKVDATMVLNIEAAKLERSPEIVSLAQVSKVLPELPYIFSATREEYIEKHPETIAAITRAMLEANRWIAANKVGTVAIALKVIPEENAETLARAYEIADPRQWSANGEITEAGYKQTMDLLLKVGYVKDPVPFDRLFDHRFLDRALRELGRQ